MPLTLPVYFLGRTYVLHTRIAGRQFKRSLKTANPKVATLRAINLLRAAQMATKGDRPDLSDFDFDADLRKYKIKVGDIEIEANDEADHRRAMEVIDRIGMIDGGFPKSRPAPPSTEKTAMAIRKGTATGDKKDKPPTTYMELFEKYKKLKGSTKRSTFKDYESTLTDFEQWADTPLLWEVDEDMITEFIEYLADKGNIEPTIDKKIGTIRSMFNFGKKHNYLSGDNPAAERNLQSRQQKYAGGHKFYELDEVKQVMGGPEFKALNQSETNFYLIAVAALLTGIRITALASLTVADFRTTVDGHPYINVQKDKTPAGRRNVPIPQVLWDRLKAYLSKNQSFGFGLREDGKGASDPVRKLLNTHLASIGMNDRGFTIHGLRKTLNGQFFRDKVDLETRCQFMGHELNNVNSTVYVPGMPMQKRSTDEIAVDVLPSQMKLLNLIEF
ncbi:phage integrase SAM-like domain-containing protein [Herbaspirillum sp. RTI4]|uniref:tyrosine-type recombinase/integrase n=1 Tax=Herbaspirillum sp. RTI4 TaxID=3048640 RepID=UPI002AB34774|nr:phage integrase SAM-like domain-containing protein [Herbaspirillum sp. RTI4]MDY7579095.1 phage integrase SAM-like domain-containing protein [Herbaspirillum sp. RTI4]MEA9981326.1 phage integrase SAM-like domain-containing protein [Herbaspirillum sp. RTI4]